ncbi:hypothetical protein AB0M94_39555 [Streptomyces xanthochromogenes]|uniref:hypothetical protein n=1 Tax=Streptomyces xanthochromogenes TaxID=67384 RepID=UPI003412C38F
MSPARRRLGTGPTTTRAAAADAPTPRLLPAERGEPTPGDEYQDVAEPPRGRRDLGCGVERDSVYVIPETHSTSR